MEKGEEAEIFVNTVLAFISAEAKLFNTTEEFIEDCLLDLVKLIKWHRYLNRENGSS